MQFTAQPPRASSILAIACAIGGAFCLSVSDLSVKFLSGSYALHQVILTRSLIGIVFVLGLIVASRTGFGQLRTRRWREHLLRVSFVTASNLTYYLGLAALPLADAVAIAFVCPLIVTVLSVVLLGEPARVRHWVAVGTGLAGVLVMMRPSAGVVQPAALLVLISAACYASVHLMTRRMRETESAIALGFYVQLAFGVVSIGMGLAVGDGRLSGSGNASLAFLLRPWMWPPLADWPAFLSAGIAVAAAGVLIAQAYRLAPAAEVAPFDYAAMPFAVIWGVLVFNRWPDVIAWTGIALICGAGMGLLWAEANQRSKARPVEDRV